MFARFLEKRRRRKLNAAYKTLFFFVAKDPRCTKEFADAFGTLFMSGDLPGMRPGYKGRVQTMTIWEEEAHALDSSPR